ncbi:hypothetical protein Tco_0947362 [Tanacetum coccineum]
MNQEVTRQVAARDEKWVPTNSSGTLSRRSQAQTLMSLFLLTRSTWSTIQASQENVDYPELIWEDFAFQIDHMQLKKGRRENMSYPSRGKGSQGKKTADTTEETVDVSEESDSEPARKRTASRRVVKKKVSIFTDDNIIPDPDVALELGKSISLTKAAEEEAVRQVHATHARIVTKSIPEPARKRPSGIAFRDTSGVSKKMSPDPSQKLQVSLRLFCSGLKVYHLPPTLSVREDAYSTKACSGLLRSKMSFHQALDLIFEFDETTVGCTRDILRQRDCLDRLSDVPWVVPTFVVIEGEKETLLDVVGTSGCRYGVLQSFSVERIEQGNDW